MDRRLVRNESMLGVMGLVVVICLGGCCMSDAGQRSGLTANGIPERLV